MIKINARLSKNGGISQAQQWLKNNACGKYVWHQSHRTKIGYEYSNIYDFREVEFELEQDALLFALKFCGD